MSPQEKASLLLEQVQQTDIAQAVARFRPNLTIPLLRAVMDHAFQAHLRNPQQALHIVDVAEAVAEAMGTHEAQALVLWVKGNTYNYLNRYQEALACFQQAESLYAAVGESLKVAAMQVNQVAALRDLADYEAAVVMAGQARATCQAVGEPADIYLANLELNLGWVQQERGDPATALATYERGRAIFNRLGDQVSVALADVNRAFVLQAMDQFGAAEVLLLAARAVFIEAGYQQEVARADLNLGTLAYRHGQYQQALHHLEAAYHGFTAISLPAEVANVNLQRSHVYRHLNLLVETIHLAEQAGQVFRARQMRREYIQCLINQGVGYQQLNLLPQAERLLARARRLLHQQGAWGVLPSLDLHRAELMLAAGRLDTAYRLMRRVEKQINVAQQPSLATRTQLLLAQCVLVEQPADLHQAWERARHALTIAQEYHLSGWRVQANYLLGRVLEARGRHEAAWQQYQQAVAVNEQLRASLLHDEFRTGFMEDKQPLYAAHIRLTHQMVTQQKAAANDLLNSLELAQTSPFQHLSSQEAAPAGDPGLQAHVAELRQTWHWYQSKLDAPDDGEQLPPTEVARWHQQRYDLENKLAELLRHGRISKTAGTSQVAAAHPWEPEARLSHLQARLGPHDLLLHYYVVQKQYQALLVTSTTTQVVPNLVGVPQLDRLLRAWRFYLHHTVTNNRTAAEKPGTAQVYLAHFYQLLVEPLQPYLQGAEQLYLVLPPDQHDLPLAALFDGQRYLAEQIRIVHLSTLGALLNAQVPSPAHPKVPASNELHTLVIGLSDNGRLPHAVAEARQVSEALSHQGKSVALLEGEATTSRFRQLCPRCHLLHLATHALFRPDNPIFSSIQLADGRITVADLYEMSLPGRPFVVLSACETGRGRPRGGGLLGMGRGFLAAGATGLIATLWPISDAASADFIGHFYQGLLLNELAHNAATALQNAQRAAIASNQPPYHWAGFILIGG